MFKSDIKKAKNGCKYLIIKYNNRNFCIFETQRFLIEKIYNDINFSNIGNYSISSLEILQKKLNNENVEKYYMCFINRWKIKKEYEEYYKRLNNVDDYFFREVMQHEKPDNFFLGIKYG